MCIYNYYFFCNKLSLESCALKKNGKLIVDNKWKSRLQIILRLYRNPNKSTSVPRNFSDMLINKEEVIHIMHEAK